MIIDAIEGAIKLAQLVRVVVSTMKGESRVTVTCRQLMHTCKLYEDCLQSLVTNIRGQLKFSSMAGIANGAASQELQRELDKVTAQIETDRGLLEEIVRELKEVEVSQSKGVVRNVIASLLTGRVEKINHLQAELVTRVAIVTAIMSKEVWKSSSGLNSALMDVINDAEGSLFWFGHFASQREISFAMFLEAFQAYLIHSFYFKQMQKSHLITLLRFTLLDDPRLDADGNTLSALPVTVNRFGLWLQRYGPMSDTIFKCAAMSLPTSGLASPWFFPNLNRELASRRILDNIAKSLSMGGMRADQLIVVRYSSDPKNFVVTTKPPTFKSVEHFIISNSAKGYMVAGEKEDYAPTIIDCVQRQIINKLFASPTGESITLSRDSIDQWFAVFSDAASELPSNHYADAAALDEAAKKITDEISVTGKSNATFRSLFVDEKMEKISSDSTFTSPVPPPPATSSTASGNSGSEKTLIGNYLVRQGLSLLREAGKINETTELLILQQIN